MELTPEKIAQKFEKTFSDQIFVVEIIQQSGYFQDDESHEETYNGKVKFHGDAEEYGNDTYSYKHYKRKFSSLMHDANGELYLAIGEIAVELRGNRFVFVDASIEDEKTLFPKLAIDTYWPDGYKVGEYNAGGVRYYSRKGFVKP